MTATRVQPTEAEKNAAKFPGAKPLAEHILTKAQASRSVVQDFVPLSESLEWELGQWYLRDRGNKAFISDASPVPFVINNDGNLSRKAAEVFFASLLEAEREGTLESDLFVLELGIGVGLFARYFLDHFEELCAKNKKNFYDRLCYIAADKSERMLLDVCRHGVLNRHPGRYRLRLVDAMCPEKDLANDVAFRDHVGRPFRAVFLNYLLDCLPAAVLEIDGEQIHQLHVRTCVARNVDLAAFSDMTLEQLQERAKASDPKSKQELLEVYGLFASEYDYRPVDVKALPYGEYTYEYAHRWAKRVLLSHGAITCLRRLLDMIHLQGFILMNDYGQTQVTREDEFEHQRFSLATFVGVNFPLLRSFFEQQGVYSWTEPTEDVGGIHSRLLGHRPAPATLARFCEAFSKAAYEKVQEPLYRARACVRMGRFELAGTFYNEALAQQPRNWMLLNEIAMFLTFSLHDAKAGIDMSKMALALNPTCSAELWNTLGDALYEWGRTAEAKSVYLKAIDVNESDVRAYYNLAHCYTREKHFAAALEMIARGFALDKAGEYRERLLRKQTDILARAALRHQQEYLLLINLVSKYAKPDDKEKAPPLQSRDAE
jgi:tetratricopeptide (TPR) repeat protein